MMTHRSTKLISDNNLFIPPFFSKQKSTAPIFLSFQSQQPQPPIPINQRHETKSLHHHSHHRNRVHIYISRK